MREEQFNEVVKWQKKTFGKTTSLSKIAHLLEEIKELIDALKTNDPETHLEFADCFLLLFGCAAADGMTYADICVAVDEKMVINKKRTWGKPDKHGVVNHIKH